MPENDDHERDTDAGTDTSTGTVDETSTEEEHDEPRPATKADGTPYTQADIDALNEALRKARSAERKHRRGRQGPAQGQDGASDETAPDVDKVRSEAESEAANRWKPLVVRQAARTAFAEAGLVVPKGREDEAMSRVLRLLDLEDIDVTESGEVDGLREQVEDIRRDWPELFATATRNGRPARLDAADRGRVGTTDKGAAQQIAAALLSGRR